MLRKLYGIVSSGSVVGSFIAIVPITLAVGLIYTVYRIAKSKKNDAPTAWGKEIIKLLFVPVSYTHLTLPTTTYV